MPRINVNPPYKREKSGSNKYNEDNHQSFVPFKEKFKKSNKSKKR